MKIAGLLAETSGRPDYETGMISDSAVTYIHIQFVYTSLCMYVHVYIAFLNEVQTKLSKPINKNIWGQGSAEVDDYLLDIIA
jgi:hypothetical protein